MSSHHTSSTSSYSYTSTTSSSTTTDGQTHSKSTTTHSSYNDRDGPRSETVTRETGKPTVVERSEGGGRIGGASGGNGVVEGRRIEDVTDKEMEEKEAEERYLEAMEDEYAKREGGA